MGNTCAIPVSWTRTAIGALAIAALAGCGGGSGGGGSALRVAGVVSQPGNGAVNGSTVAGATVNAYVWPDLTKSVGSSVTDASGRYTIGVPPEGIGKDLVLVATKTAGEQTLRLSAIAADFSSQGSAEIGLDGATTAAAETIVNTARAAGIADISGSSVRTVAEEYRHWTGASTMSVVAGGEDLPGSFGEGLPDASPCHQFSHQNGVIAAALGALADTASADVKQARRLAGTVRDFGVTVTRLVSGDFESMQGSINQHVEQASAAATSMADVGKRLDYFTQLVGLNTRYPNDSLKGKAPGAYSLTLDTSGSTGGPAWKLSSTGAASDGKSWIVTSALTDASAGTVTTITPRNALSTFALSLAGGGYTFAMRNPADTALRYDGTFSQTTTALGLPTQLKLTVTLNDKALTQPIAFNGTLSGVPATSGADYRQLAFSGSLTAQVGSASVGSASMQFGTGLTVGDLSKIQLSNLKLTLTPANPITVSIDNASLDFYPASGTQTGLKPKTFNFGGSLVTSTRSLVVSNVQVVFAQTTGSYVLPSSLTGNVKYTSTGIVSATGALTASWTNPTPGAWFGINARFVGTSTPAVGIPGSIDVSGATTSTPSPQLTVTLNKLAYGSETVTGAASVPLKANGGIDKGATVTLDLTHQPSGMVAHVSGTEAALSGGIYTSAAMTTKVADIGKAKDLGLPDLGSLLIIRYSDGSFETVASILP